MEARARANGHLIWFRMRWGDQQRRCHQRQPYNVYIYAPYFTYFLLLFISLNSVRPKHKNSHSVPCALRAQPHSDGLSFHKHLANTIKYLGFTINQFQPEATFTYTYGYYGYGYGCENDDDGVGTRWMSTYKMWHKLTGAIRSRRMAYGRSSLLPATARKKAKKIRIRKFFM